MLYYLYTCGCPKPTTFSLCIYNVHVYTQDMCIHVHACIYSCPDSIPGGCGLRVGSFQIWSTSSVSVDLDTRYGTGMRLYLQLHHHFFAIHVQAMATVNMRRKIYSILRGAFSEEGLTEFIRNLIGQRGVTVAFDDLPAIPSIEPWDGRDGEVSDVCTQTLTTHTHSHMYMYIMYLHTHTHMLTRRHTHSLTHMRAHSLSHTHTHTLTAASRG